MFAFIKKAEVKPITSNRLLRRKNLTWKTIYSTGFKSCIVWFMKDGTVRYINTIIPRQLAMVANLMFAGTLLQVLSYFRPQTAALPYPWLFWHPVSIHVIWKAHCHMRLSKHQSKLSCGLWFVFKLAKASFIFPTLRLKWTSYWSFLEVLWFTLQLFITFPQFLINQEEA